MGVRSIASFRIALLLAVGLISAGCTARVEHASEQVPAFPVWYSASPASQGLDPKLLAEADRHARTDFKGVTSLLVARHGRLVFERYFEGIQAADRVPVFSVTKSVVSALVGIALAEGKLRSVDERLSEVLPEATALTDSRARSITLRDLLSMTAGYGRALNFRQIDASSLANRPLANDPGTTFVYDSGSSDLLAFVLARVTGMMTAEYSRRRLFGPMGIRDVRWPSSGGGSGLVLRPRDLLAFGQMYLDGGKWNGRRIVPAAWVRTSTHAHVRVPPAQGATLGYGYDWWIDDRELHFFMAHGYLGQALVVVPRLDEVILVTSSREDGRTFGLVRLVMRATHA